MDEWNSIFYTPRNEFRRVIMFLTRPSVSQSVRQSCFSCQHNSSKTAQHNFVKLFTRNFFMRMSTGKFDSFFLSELRHFWTEKFDQNERYYWKNWMKNTNVPNVPYMFYNFCTYRIYEWIMLYFPGVNWHLWLIYQLNT